MGPPGVGKGTQARALGEGEGWVHLSTGELFRDHAKRRTDLGKLAKSYMDKGQYLPDDVTVGIVRERLLQIGPSTRIVFDGFPRTVAQALALETLLAEFDRKVGAVVLLEAPREQLRLRLLGRAKAEGRTDDTPEVIANRLDAYEQQTGPVVAHYDARGMVRRVNGLGSVADVAARLRGAT